ncbi:MAG: tRNA uridine(34) 5-carboxymethylaminomethyl modification radical SAM/GNAT enzyme Elp3 [Candidatus Lokiarchaeota archaeon]|nr:tRNA uridine(34) 5-carboxymethylaminomethyl modification radical SAM/GNAT enzyme Elp3 [Candidatus Lokiarchaeota archaeon]
MVDDFDDTEKLEKLSREIINYLVNNPNTSRHRITNLKGKIGKKYHLDSVIKNASILRFASHEEKKIITPLLKRRKTRTNSGVSVIAIMTKPLPCPGACIYCPGQNSQPGQKVAQSYTGQEPAALRSINNQYDPFKQVQSRISDLEAIGHIIDKIELICMGGTFLSTPINYQQQFIQGAYEGILNRKVSDINEAKRLAENSKRRLIGITIETRPDYCKEEHVDRMLSYGVTRVELGIQTVFDDIFELVKRGHTTKESIEAIRIARDAGLKINAHIMPNLPGSDYSRDLTLFRTLFSNSDYKPDMLKIYPCLVIKGTELYEWWKNDIYHPYSTTRLIDLIAQIKKEIPPYVRIQRIMRDIPAPLIEAGCKKSNLRQLVKARLDEDKSKCNCIRCREYGLAQNKQQDNNNNFEGYELKRINYEASQGEEIFLSFENDNLLIGYLRLRKPSEFSHRSELNNGNTLIVREIRIVGEIVPTDSVPIFDTQIQHRGFGKMLLEEAEKISREEYGAKKLAVISGVGAKNWFYKLGYESDGPYVSKNLVF